MAKKDWIKTGTENKGGLHRSLGIAEGKKIPEKRIEAATHSKSPKVRKQAYEAETLSKLRKQGKAL